MPQQSRAFQIKNTITIKPMMVKTIVRVFIQDYKAFVNKGIYALLFILLFAILPISFYSPSVGIFHGAHIPFGGVLVIM